MNIESSDLRVSDTEREDAIQKLGEHMSVGRLGVDEYGDRSARVATARTRGELLELFTDLPDPKPRFSSAAMSLPPPVGPSVGSAGGPAARPAAGRPAGWDQRPPAQRVWGAMVPLSAIVALVLYLTVVHMWFVFLLPAVIAVVGGAIWGEDWRHHQHHHRARYDYRYGRDHRRRR